MKSNKLYVSNLDYSVIEVDLEELFFSYGTVLSVRIIRDRKTGRSRGFAFVTMSSIEEAKTAKIALDGTNIKGRNLKIVEAREPKKKRGSSEGSKERMNRIFSFLKKKSSFSRLSDRAWLVIIFILILIFIAIFLIRKC